jgi:drug/metabolite transporter (DMT)-like permease
MGQRYRRKSAASSIVSDTVDMGARLPWWGALILGLVTFILFYFIVPAWLESKLAAEESNRFYPMLEVMLGRRIHWFEWIGVACGLIGLFFGIRNYLWSSPAGYDERGVVALLAKIFGRDIS